MLGRPAEPFAGATGVGPAAGDLAGPHEGRVADDVPPPVEPDRPEGLGHERLEARRHAGGDHEVLEFVLLEHPVHRHDVFRGPAPVAADREVAQPERLLLPARDPAGRRHDLLGHEPLGPQRALVVEEDPGGRGDAIGLAVLGDLPEGGRLGDSVGAARLEHGGLAGRLFPGVSEHLRTAGVVQPHRPPQEPDRLEQVERADDDALEGLDRLIERQAHARLAGQVVDLVGGGPREDLQRGAEVDQRHRDEADAVADFERLEPREPAPLGVAARPHDRVSEREQVGGQVGAVLTADAADHGGAAGEFGRRCAGGVAHRDEGARRGRGR